MNLEIYKRDVAMVFCISCVHPIGYTCISIGDSQESAYTSAFTGAPVVPPGIKAEYQGKSVAICPNCQEGRLLFWDQRLVENPSYNPFARQHFATHEDKKILIEWLEGNEPKRN